MSFITDYLAKMYPQDQYKFDPGFMPGPPTAYMGAQGQPSLGSPPGVQSGGPGPAAPAPPPQMAAGSPTPFMLNGPGLGTLAGGAAPQPPQPQAPAAPQAPQPTAGFYGGSPATNPNLRPIDQPDYGKMPDQTQPYTPPGAALIQKMISALGGVTNGGPLSVIGGQNPGSFNW